MVLQPSKFLIDFCIIFRLGWDHRESRFNLAILTLLDHGSKKGVHYTNERMFTSENTFARQSKKTNVSIESCQRTQQAGLY